MVTKQLTTAGKIAAPTTLIAAALVAIFGPKINGVSTQEIAGYVATALGGITLLMHAPTVAKGAVKVSKKIPKPKAKPKPPAALPKFTVMYDSTNLRRLPRISSSSSDVVAAYDDGLFNNIAQARQLYPNHRHLTIGVKRGDPADVLDDEPGNVIATSDPVERAKATADWIQERFRAGAPFVGAYADGSDWGFLHTELQDRGLDTRPLIQGGNLFKFLADPTGHPHIPDGYDACQYLWEANFDESLVYTASLRRLPRA